MARYVYRTTFHGFEGSEHEAVVEHLDGFERVSEHYEPMKRGTPDRPHYFSAACLTILWRREEP